MTDTQQNRFARYVVEGKPNSLAHLIPGAGQTGAKLTQVEHDPFAAPNVRKTAVEHDPFEDPNTITVSGPDGLSVTFPQGTDRDTINRVMSEAHQRHQGNRANRFSRYLNAGSDNRFAHLIPAQPSEGTTGPQQSNLAEKTHFGGAAPKKDLAISALQGASLGFADEIMSGLAAPIATAANKLGLMEGDALPRLSDNFDQGRALLQAQQARLEAENPGAALAAEIGGALATAKVPAGLVAKGGGVLAKTGKGIATGASYGGLAGFGEGNGLDDRLERAKSGAQTGAIVGSLISPVAQVAGKGYEIVSKRLANRALAKEAGVKPKVFREVSKAYADDAAMGFKTRPDNADMLLNRGNALQLLAEEIASQPGLGRNRLLQAVEQQQSGAGKRIAATVDATLGQDRGRVANAATIEADRKAAGKLFDVAKQHTGKFDVTALRDNLATTIAETDGPVRRSILAVRRLHLFHDGVVKQASATQLHSARQAVDDMLNGPGVGSNTARLLRQVRDQFDTVLKGNVPGWQQADDAYNAVMKRREALEEGRGVFSRSYGSPAELQSELQKMSPATRSDFLKGARDSVAEIMGSARNDAAAARRDLLEKGWNREKLQLLIGKQSAEALESQLVKEANRAQAAQNITGNSRTALRQNARRAFPGANSSNPDLKNVSAIGAALEVGSKALSFVTGTRRAELSRQAAQLLTAKAKDVEPLLQAAQQLAGRRLNVREQIETIAGALAYSGLQHQAGTSYAGR